MTKIGQTRHRSHKQIVELIEGYIGRKIDYILINNGRIPEEAYKRYVADGESLIIDDLEKTKKRKIIYADLVANDVIKKDKGDKLVRSLIRHDSKKLAKELYKIFNDSSIRRFLKGVFSQYID